MSRSQTAFSLLIPALFVIACSSDTTSASAGSDASSSEGDETETSGTSETETGGEENLCGNGMLDPGEACEPVGSSCDTCTWDCRENPLPANEWIVELPLLDPHAYRTQPYEKDERWHILATGSAPVLAVRGTTIEGEAWLFTFTPAGEAIAAAGPDEHGFDLLRDHAVGPGGDVVLFGLVGGTPHLRRMLADGTLAAPIEVSPATEQVAITSMGFVTLAAGGPAHAIDFGGEALWQRDGPFETLGGVEDRVLLHSIENYVEFVSADGGEILTWDWTFHPSPEYSRLASVPALMLAGNFSLEDTYVSVLDLWTGETTTTLLFTSGLGGLEVHPSATALDARPDGWPLLSWFECLNGGAGGCTEGINGVGGPDELHAVDLHPCDFSRSTRIGTDGGVFVIAEQPDGSMALARRTTL